MLPFDKKPSGKLAYQRLRTYIGVPNDTKPLEKIQFEKLAVNANIFLKNNMTWDVILPKFINFYEKLLK